MDVYFIYFTKCVHEDRKLNFNHHTYPCTCLTEVHQVLWHSFYGQSTVSQVWLFIHYQVKVKLIMEEC